MLRDPSRVGCLIGEVALGIQMAHVGEVVIRVNLDQRFHDLEVAK